MRYYTLTQVVDVVANGCSFIDLYHSDVDSDNGEGGAIWCYTHGSVEIEASLFKNCGAVNRGGAISADSEWFNMRRSCAVYCYTTAAGAEGGAIWMEPDDEVSDFSEDSFLFTNIEGGNSNGTIFYTENTGNIFEAPDVQISKVNFTSCRASNGGSAFTVAKSISKWAASYLVLRYLTGATGIHALTTSLKGVDHCNFYDNPLSADGGVLYGESCGMTVDSCIFKNNSRDIVMKENPSSSSKFRLTNCVFSGSFPETNWVSRSGCFQGSVTASFVITGWSECPTYPATISFSPSPTNGHTPVPTNRDTPIPTNSETPTNSYTAPPTNSETPIPTNSNTPTNSYTPPLTASPPFQASGRLTQANRVTVSAGSTESSPLGGLSIYGALQDGSELNDGEAALSGGAVGGIAVGCCAVLVVVILLFSVKHFRRVSHSGETETNEENESVEGELHSTTHLETSQTVIDGFSNPVSADRPSAAVGNMGVMLLGEGANQIWE
jgi:hypothetical protein